VNGPVLSFDLTGTLSTFNFCDSVYFEGLPRLYSVTHDVDVEEARGYLTQCYDEVGDHEADWYDIAYWFDRFRLGDGWHGLLHEYSRNIEFFPDAEPVLKNLSRKYEIILVSNACSAFLDFELVSFKQYFSRIISCVSDFRQVKKTSEFYRKLCDHIDRQPGEIIHVGDHWQFDFIAPTGAGLKAYYLDRKGISNGDGVIHTLHELEDKLL